MAIVANKRNGDTLGLDASYCTYNRTMAGTPNGVFTPAFAGEIVWDSTNKVRWKSLNLLNSGWVPVDVEVT